MNVIWLIQKLHNFIHGIKSFIYYITKSCDKSEFIIVTVCKIYDPICKS